MNLHEAYETLGLDESASEEDINKAFRKLAAKHHPDKNKDNQEESEAKFKKINEAAQILKNPPSEPEFMNAPRWSNVPNFVHFSSFNRQPNHPPPQVHLTISFEESVLGCEREIQFTRYVKCTLCNGAGLVLEVDKCERCNGAGMQTSSFQRSSSSVRFMTPCMSCNGTGRKSHKCSTCLGSGDIPEQATHKVNIPGGLHNGEQVRLSRAGNYLVSEGPAQFFSDVYIIVSVTPDKEMVLDHEGNVHSTIKLSLLEALKGTKKKVRTVKGSLTLNIRAGIKNGNTIKAGSYGARSRGDHLFDINVDYPNDIKPLIELLEKQEI